MKYLFKNVDYSNPIFAKRIERENAYIYGNLIKIYCRISNFGNFSHTKYHEYQQNEFRKSKKLARTNNDKAIRVENQKIAKRLINIKPNKNLTVNECNKHWNVFLDYKRRRFLTKNAKAKFSY